MEFFVAFIFSNGRVIRISTFVLSEKLNSKGKQPKGLETQSCNFKI